MQTITLSVKNLNASLQVGDIVYARPTTTQANAVDAQVGTTTPSSTGAGHVVGILSQISTTNNGLITVLNIDDSAVFNPYTPQVNDFLMFSKYSQTNGDINGYYAKANFINDSREKAELFAVSSEIVINSK